MTMTGLLTCHLAFVQELCSLPSASRHTAHPLAVVKCLPALDEEHLPSGEGHLAGEGLRRQVDWRFAPDGAPAPGDALGMSHEARDKLTWRDHEERDSQTQDNDVEHVPLEPASEHDGTEHHQDDSLREGEAVAKEFDHGIGEGG